MNTNSTLSQEEINKRLARIYEMALKASERQEYVVALYDHEVKDFRHWMREEFGIDLEPVE